MQPARDPLMGRVVLLRHGQPAGVAPQSFLGHSDPPLNDDGRQQALAAAQCLLQMKERGRIAPPAALWCSDLQRAQQTAAPLARLLDCPVRGDERLREIDFGAWDQCTFNEVDAREAGAARAWFHDPLGRCPRDGESLTAVYERVGAFLQQELASVDAQQSLIVVAHFGSLAMVAAWLLGLDPATALRVVLQRGECGYISNGALRWWGLPGG